MSALLTDGTTTLEVTFDGHTQNYGLAGRIRGHVNYGLSGRLHKLIVRRMELTDQERLLDMAMQRRPVAVWWRDRTPLLTDGRRMGPIERSRFEVLP